MIKNDALICNDKVLLIVEPLPGELARTIILKNKKKLQNNIFTFQARGEEGGGGGMLGIVVYQYALFRSPVTIYFKNTKLLIPNT